MLKNEEITILASARSKLNTRQSDDPPLQQLGIILPKIVFLLRRIVEQVGFDINLTVLSGSGKRGMMTVWLLNILLFWMSRQADDLPAKNNVFPVSETSDLHQTSQARHDTREKVTREEIARLFGNGLRER